MSRCEYCYAEGFHKFSCPLNHGRITEDMAADWTNHRIEGFARAAIENGAAMLDAKFSAPLISHIEDNLWVGGCIDRVKLPEDFVKVFSMYSRERYDLGSNTERVEVEMRDSNDWPDEDEINGIVDQVVESLERGKTLVHCQAGLNRSNLIAACTLVRLGRTPEEAISLLREKRSPLALCNKTFENYVLSEDKRQEFRNQ